MEPAKSSNKRLLELDALRGFAALFVVLYHFTIIFPASVMGFKNFGLEYGATGVELFFMISGFVIFMSMVNLNSEKEFIINRVARLYPAYWASVIFTFTIMVFSQKFFFHHWLGVNIIGRFFVNLSMLQHAFNVIDIDAPYWTLYVEIIFYAFIWSLSVFKFIHYIEKICFGILLFILTINYIGYFSKVSFSTIFSIIPLLTYFPLFYAGIIFYKMFTGKKTFFRYLILALCLYTQTMQYGNRYFPGGNFTGYALILFAYFILFILFINNKLNFIVNKLTVYLGSISYALYLSHYYISVSILLPALVHKMHMPFIIAATITLIIVLVIAHVITKTIDVPYRHKLRAFLRKYL